MDADVDLRKLRYFVAVAEELNFGRAAQRLHVAQPALSRQIRALEQELRVQLFARDTRGTALTDAGRQLLSDARPLLAEATALRRRARAAARSAERSFTVGFMPGLTVTAAVRAMRRAYPDLDVRVLRTSWDDQSEMIRDGRVDIGYVRLPIDPRGLAVEPLFEEARVAVLPLEHRLAGKAEIRIADLADEHLLQDPNAVPEWRDIATELRSGTRAAEHPARTVEEKLEQVASGRGVSVLPLSTATFYTRPDVSHSLIVDIGPNKVCLAWSADRRDPMLRDYLAIAQNQQAEAGRS
jgi:DNA-binding transcriptional LysR family regulator